MNTEVSTKFLILAAFCVAAGFSGGSMGSPGSQLPESVSSHKRSVGWRCAVRGPTNSGNPRTGMLLVFSYGQLSGVRDVTPAGPVPNHSTPSVEQIAVYKAFVAYFADRAPYADVADLTYPMSRAREACLRGIDLEKSEAGASAVQTLPPQILPDTGKFRIVTIRSGSEQHERLLRLSAIAFDPRHRYAVLNYSYHCGVLCGEGGTVVLKKIGPRWKHLRSCKEWIS